MTEVELALLRSLAETDMMTFVPEGSSAGALAKFEVTLASLRKMQKAGWIELKVLPENKQRVANRRRQKHRGAAARCTVAGREALRLLEE